LEAFEPAADGSIRSIVTTTVKVTDSPSWFSTAVTSVAEPLAARSSG
jgi:hypothetical protein